MTALSKKLLEIKDKIIQVCLQIFEKLSICQLENVWKRAIVFLKCTLNIN